MFMGLPQIEIASQIFENENDYINEMDLINGFGQASAGFASDPLTRSGQARGSLQKEMEENLVKQKQPIVDEGHIYKGITIEPYKGRT